MIHTIRLISWVIPPRFNAAGVSGFRSTMVFKLEAHKICPEEDSVLDSVSFAFELTFDRERDRQWALRAASEDIDIDHPR